MSPLIPTYIFLATLGLVFMSTLLARKNLKFFKKKEKKPEIQDLHIGEISRYGGTVLFFISFLLAIYIYQLGKVNHDFLVLLVCVTLFSTIGILEDIFPGIAPWIRLFLTFLVAIATTSLLTPLNISTNVDLLNQVLSKHVVLTFFAVLFIATLTHSHNIIDGLNGLSSGSGLCALLAIALLSYQVNDFELGIFGLIFLSMTLGFFINNYPIARIFLGDGGAYWVGSSVAILSLLLMARNPSVNIWTILLVNFYPLFETLFSVYRKAIVKKINPFRPDRKHLHMLMFRACAHLIDSQKITFLKAIHVNSLSSSILLFLPISSSIMAILTQHTFRGAIYSLIALSISYIFLYINLNHFDKSL